MFLFGTSVVHLVVFFSSGYQRLRWLAWALCLLLLEWLNLDLHIFFYFFDVQSLTLGSPCNHLVFLHLITVWFSASKIAFCWCCLPFVKPCSRQLRSLFRVLSCSCLMPVFSRSFPTMWSPWWGNVSSLLCFLACFVSVMACLLFLLVSLVGYRNNLIFGIDTHLQTV